MRLIHKVPFTAQEVETYRQLVFNNITHGLRIVFEALDDLELKVADGNQVRRSEMSLHEFSPRSTSGVCGAGYGCSRSTRRRTVSDPLLGGITIALEGSRYREGNRTGKRGCIT